MPELLIGPRFPGQHFPVGSIVTFFDRHRRTVFPAVTELRLHEAIVAGGETGRWRVRYAGLRLIKAGPTGRPTCGRSKTTPVGLLERTPRALRLTSTQRRNWAARLQPDEREMPVYGGGSTMSVAPGAGTPRVHPGAGGRGVQAARSRCEKDGDRTGRSTLSGTVTERPHYLLATRPDLPPPTTGPSPQSPEPVSLSVLSESPENCSA